MRIAQSVAALGVALVLLILLVTPVRLAIAQDGRSDAPPPTTDPEKAGIVTSDQDADDSKTKEPSTEHADDEPLPEDTGPRRVIIVVDRYTTTAGEVVEEDENIIVIRNRRDKAESFSKAQVLAIVPLLNVTEPREGVVVMRNGQAQRALIIEDHYDYVIVEIEGIRTKFDRRSVSHAAFQPTFEERYREIRLTIDPGTIKHLDLCKWLMDHHRYDLAVEELESLMDAGAPNEEAPQLLRIARAQLILMEDKQDDIPLEDSADADADDAAKQVMRDLSRQILTPEQVNLVRVFEIDFRNPPKVLVTPETIRKIQENYGTSPLIPANSAARTEMFRADDIELVRLMFELRARELYSEIEVQSEPFALNQFRDGVHHGWLISNCATSRCHGGPDAGRLFLHNRRYRDARVWMANFLTLERLEVDPVHPLINYENPEMSLLLQYALNPNEARMPHPDVRGWRPVFPRKNRQFWESVSWIDSMMQPRPEYPVEYEPPIPPAARSSTKSPGERADR